ncbi:MAG: M23/M56 family metallopeptidase [Bacteroidota bacterium]
MPINYLLEAAFYLTFTLLVYRLLFSRFTFFQANRAFLLFGLAVSLTLPALPAFWEIEVQTAESSVLHGFLDAEDTLPLFLGDEEVFSEAVALGQSTNWIQLIWLSGAAIFLLRLLWNLGYATWLLGTATRLRVKGITVYVHKKVASPCSLFSHILLPSTMSATAEVLRHERTHAREHHWLDLLLAELTILIFWFFPIAYLLKRAIQNNLEFVADRAVLTDYPRLSYQKQLLEAIQTSPHLQFTQAFFSSSLKMRFNMMKKSSTANWKQVTYACLFPVFLIPSFNLSPKADLINDQIIERVYTEGFTALYTDPETAFYPDFWPIKNDDLTRLSSGFGMRIHPVSKARKMHMGVDFTAEMNTPVYAAASGVIKLAREKGNYGNTIEIQHGDSGYLTRYAHLADFNVKEGQTVEKGDKIGFVGSSGLSFAPHLHFEIRKDGKPVNPIGILEER